jgi:DNA-binding transcriptional MerR regulator
MQIGQAAQASGLSADTIRFYESEGVLPAPARASNGYRSYSAEHVRRLRLARSLRDLGLALDEVGEIVAVAHDGTCGDLRVALRSRLGGALEAIDARVAELEETRREVSRITRGLSRMRVGEENVPGLTACNCVTIMAGTD